MFPAHGSGTFLALSRWGSVDQAAALAALSSFRTLWSSQAGLFIVRSNFAASRGQ
jgi:hypothetical protein